MTHAGGMSHAPTVAMMRSYGACSVHPRPPSPQPTVTWRDPTLGQAGTGVLDEVNVDVDGHHSPGLADKLGQQRRVIAAARPDFQHAMAWAHIELLKHSGHDRRL